MKKESIATRDGFGDAILEAGENNKEIFVIVADSGKSCKADKFKNKLPNQYLNVGIAEQNAAGIAAGLATCGKIPVLAVYAIFASMRMCEQIRQEICYPNLNVKIAASHGGFTPANDGASHQCVEDFGILSTIPNMTVIMPADYYSTKKLVKSAIAMNGPVYLRFTRDPIPCIYDDTQEFEIGKAIQLKDGKDIAIIANGDTVHLALEAYEILKEKNISARVLDMHTVKPIDVDAITKCCHDIGKIITIEDHNIINGMGSMVANVAADLGKGIVKKIGVQDKFGMSAPYERLLATHGITVDNIVNTALGLL